MKALAHGIALLLYVSTHATAVPECTAQPAPPPDGMARIPGGTFYMGTDTLSIPGLRARFDLGEWAFYAPELPRHLERVASFWMDRTEVTNASFAAFLEAQPEWSKDRIPEAFHNGAYLAHWDADGVPEDMGDHPVVNVSWYAAVAYCQWKGGRLPTEAEWEYAAGARDEGRSNPWGDARPDTTLANYAASGIGAPTRVMSYPPNTLGLYDLAGNVWEFVADEWRDDYSLPRRSAPATPEDVTTRRVIRGGSWGGHPVNLRVRFRDSHPPEGAGPHVGFRCVVPVR